MTYEYFPGTYEADCRRSPDGLTEWMMAAEFDSVDCRVVDRVSDDRTVLDDPMLRKEGTSVLTPLTDNEYEAGLERIHGAIARADATGAEILFRVELSLVMTVGRLGSR